MVKIEMKSDYLKPTMLNHNLIHIFHSNIEVSRYRIRIKQHQIPHLHLFKYLRKVLGHFNHKLLSLDNKQFDYIEKRRKF